METLLKNVTRTTQILIRSFRSQTVTTPRLQSVLRGQSSLFPPAYPVTPLDNCLPRDLKLLSVAKKEFHQIKNCLGSTT